MSLNWTRPCTMDMKCLMSDNSYVITEIAISYLLYPNHWNTELQHIYLEIFNVIPQLVSSEPSLQSLSWSQRQLWGIHSPVKHENWLPVHAIYSENKRPVVNIMYNSLFNIRKRLQNGLLVLPCLITKYIHVHVPFMISISNNMNKHTEQEHIQFWWFFLSA